MTLVINALKLKEEKIKELQGSVNRCMELVHRVPKLVILNASNDRASKLYINNKVKMCNEIGIEVELIECPETVTTEDLEIKIGVLNRDTSTTAMILQLPLYPHLDKDRLIPLIDPIKDCDGFSDMWLGKLIQGEDTILPCTPKGVMNILKHHQVDLVGKEACVIGKSSHVGMPLSILLAQEGATTTIAHSKSDLETVVKRSDIVISCVGKYNLVKPEWIKEGATIIGVGYDVDPKGKLCTDYVINDVVSLNKAKFVGNRVNTTGVSTVLSLCENVVKLFELQHLRV